MDSKLNISVELFVATGCRHCPLILNELSEQLKNGKIASLNVTNIAVDNKKAEKLNIRSVPWFSLTNDHSYMIFSGEHSPKEIQKWIQTAQTDLGMQKYIEEFLGNGQLMTIAQAIQLQPKLFSSIINMLEDEETSMNIRIGLDALIENFSASKILQQHSDEFKKIASADNVRLQIDALHYIALTGDKNNIDFLKDKTKDENIQIKEAATEALETLNDLLSE